MAVSAMHLERLIGELTENKNLELKEEVMKKIKELCKQSNGNISRTYYLLMTQLKKNHAEVRYIILLAVNELFIRSSEFRKLLEKEFLQFIHLVTETKPEEPLPPPKAVAKRLQLKAFHIIKMWHQKFGETSKILKFGYNFLKPYEELFAGREENSSRERENADVQHRERILANKVTQMRNEMQDMKSEILSVVSQTENCFQLILPFPCDMFNTPNTDSSSLSKDDNVDDSMSDASERNDDSLRHHGIYDMKSSLTIDIPKSSAVVVEENDDTSPILENLKDLYGQIKSKYLPAVLKWLKVFTKGKNCDDLLKQAIDLKLMLEDKISKFNDLKIQPKVLPASDDDELEDLEEVMEKEGFEPVIPQHKHKEYVVAKEIRSKIQISCITCTPSSTTEVNITIEKKESHLWSLKHEEYDAHDPTSRASTLKALMNKTVDDISEAGCSGIGKQVKNPNDVTSDSDSSTSGCRKDLLEKAPKRPYDIDLYHWEEKKLEAPLVVKYDNLDGFWKTKSDDEENEVLAKESIASLRTRTIDFSGKFEPVKWACRAPLPSGKLCPRHDRYKCPFHGKIIKRDRCGNPVEANNVVETTVISQPSTSKEVPDWQDPELLRDIEGATGINLKMPAKRQKKQCKKKKKIRTNIKALRNSVYERLYKKLAKSHKRAARRQDELDQKKYQDKFGHQWNYSLKM